MDMDLIAFDGTLFQVLELPEKPVRRANAPGQSQIANLIHNTARSLHYER